MDMCRNIDWMNCDTQPNPSSLKEKVPMGTSVKTAVVFWIDPKVHDKLHVGKPVSGAKQITGCILNGIRRSDGPVFVEYNEKVYLCSLSDTGEHKKSVLTEEQQKEFTAVKLYRNR